MKPLIALCGKGGTGKSTLAALLVQQLAASGLRPVLAVDADPNSCLADLLGFPEHGTMSQLRDAIRNRDTSTPSPSAVAQVDRGLNEIVAEGNGFDLLTMGLPEGPGCYCYINALLKDWLSKAVGGYAACVVDNQAGMEHLSRLVARDVHALVMVAEPTLAAARAVGRIVELSNTLPMRVANRVLIWNKVRCPEIPAALCEAAGERAVDAVFHLAWNERLMAAYGPGHRLQPADVPELQQIARAVIAGATTALSSSTAHGDRHAGARHS